MAVALEKAVPPAGVSEVSEWLEHFAKDILVTRAQQVADIESNSQVGPVSLGAIQGEVGSDPSRVSSPRVSSPSLSSSSASAGPFSGSQTGDAPRSDLSTISVASQANVPTDARRRKTIMWWVGGGVAGVGAIVLFFALRSTSPASSPPAAAAAPPPVSARPSSPPPPPPPIYDTPAPSASVAAVAPSAPPPKPVSGIPKSWPGPPRPAPPAAVPHPPPAQTTSCNPPFTYDAQGLKHFKPECL
jgi:serine/threonine-protein kinase